MAISLRVVQISKRCFILFIIAVNKVQSLAEVLQESFYRCLARWFLRYRVIVVVLKNASLLELMGISGTRVDLQGCDKIMTKSMIEG
jgi:hypothetical protein